MKEQPDRPVGDGGTFQRAGDERGGGDQEPGEPLRSWRVGMRAPTPPERAAVERLVEAVGPRLAQESYTVLRATLLDGDPETRDAVLREVADEPAVLGTSVGHDCGPDEADRFDALVAPEHDPVNVATALAAADGVVGVALAEYPSADADGAAAPEVEDSPGVFDELKGDIAQVSYEDLLEELDDAGLGPGDDEVDISPMLDADADGAGGAAEADGGARADPSEVAAAAEEVELDGDAPSPSTNAADDVDEGGTNGNRSDPAELDPDAVLSALLSALEDADLPEEDERTLRAAAGLEAPESLRARFEHLQGQVQELLAYTDALASFIDEVGEDGRGFEAIRERVDDVEARVDAATEAEASLEARLSDHNLRLEEIESRDRETAERVDDLEATVREVETALAEIEAAVEDAGVDDETVKQLLERQHRIEDAAVVAVEQLDGRIDEMESELSAVREWRDRLQGALTTGEIPE